MSDSCMLFVMVHDVLLLNMSVAAWCMDIAGQSHQGHLGLCRRAWTRQASSTRSLPAWPTSLSRSSLRFTTRRCADVCSFASLGRVTVECAPAACDAEQTRELLWQHALINSLENLSHCNVLLPIYTPLWQPCRESICMRIQGLTNFADCWAPGSQESGGLHLPPGFCHGMALCKRAGHHAAAGGCCGSAQPELAIPHRAQDLVPVAVLAPSHAAGLPPCQIEGLMFCISWKAFDSSHMSCVGGNAVQSCSGGTTILPKCK